MANTNITTLQSSTLLVTLNISVWTGRKKDKSTELEVQASKNAGSKRATSVSKHLFAECPALEAIQAFAADSRIWFIRITSPWDNNGRRITPTATWFELAQEANRRKGVFDGLVQTFLGVYKTEISKQAFSLGALFDRSEYPDVSEIPAKFAFSIRPEPLPSAGDFRVDLPAEGLAELATQYEQNSNTQLKAAMDDAYNRVKDTVVAIRDRMQGLLEYEPDAKEEKQEDGTLKIVKTRRPKVYQSMLDNCLELCELMKGLNITHDPVLEQARHELERAVVTLDVDSIKESPEVQESVKTKMDNILSLFNV